MIVINNCAFKDKSANWTIEVIILRLKQILHSQQILQFCVRENNLYTFGQVLFGKQRIKSLFFLVKRFN